MYSRGFRGSNTTRHFHMNIISRQWAPREDPTKWTWTSMEKEWYYDGLRPKGRSSWTLQYIKLFMNPVGYISLITPDKWRRLIWWFGQWNQEDRWNTGPKKDLQQVGFDIPMLMVILKTGWKFWKDVQDVEVKFSMRGWGWTADVLTVLVLASCYLWRNWWEGTLTNNGIEEDLKVTYPGPVFSEESRVGARISTPPWHIWCISSSLTKAWIVDERLPSH